MGILGLAVGVARGLTAVLAGARVRLPWKAALLALVYVASFAASGALVGLLWPATRWWLARVALALLFGFVFFAGIFVVLYGVPWRWGAEPRFLYPACSLTLAGIVWFVNERDRASTV